MRLRAAPATPAAFVIALPAAVRAAGRITGRAPGRRFRRRPPLSALDPNAFSDGGSWAGLDGAHRVPHLE
ncbi:hypothetical protein GCM10018987_15900 [Streptomyces cremeus]